MTSSPLMVASFTVPPPETAASNAGQPIRYASCADWASAEHALSPIVLRMTMVSIATQPEQAGPARPCDGSGSEIFHVHAPRV